MSDVFSWECKLSDNTEFELAAYFINRSTVRLLFEKRISHEHSVWIHDHFCPPDELTQVIADLREWLLERAEGAGEGG